MTPGRRSRRWTLRGRADDRIAALRHATASWLSSIIHSLALGEDHEPVISAAFVADEPRESSGGSRRAAAAGAMPTSESIAPAFEPRSAAAHVSWGA